jgi:hypothetical protein
MANLDSVRFGNILAVKKAALAVVADDMPRLTIVLKNCG